MAANRSRHVAPGCLMNATHAQIGNCMKPNIQIVQPAADGAISETIGVNNISSAIDG